MNLSDKCMHLTNTSVNKLNPGYVMNDGLNALRAHKWSFGNLWSHLSEEGMDVAELWSKIKDIVVKTLIAAESSMNAAISETLTSRYTSYELYGFDVLLDETFKPWLLEVNILPSLHTDSALDTIIKVDTRSSHSIPSFTLNRCTRVHWTQLQFDESGPRRN